MDVTTGLGLEVLATFGNKKYARPVRPAKASKMSQLIFESFVSGCGHR